MAFDAIDTLLEQAVATGNTPGTAALVATPDGIVYAGTAGKRALGGEADFTLDTVCYYASNSKAITTVAAMQLVEQGKLHLDDPADTVLPWLKEIKVLDGFDAMNQPRLRAPRSIPTLRQLLTHTSGFSYEIWNADILRYLETTELPGLIEARKTTLLVPLACDPGTRWEYGLSVAVAGQMVEAASGQDLETYFKENVTGPLGMGSTSFILSADQRARLAAIHARHPDGRLEVSDFIFCQEPEYFMGGESLYGTPADYMRFLQMILNGGELNGTRLLRTETIAEMSKNQIGELFGGPLITAIPEFSNDADFFPTIPQKWGLGFLINTEAGPEGRSAGSLAWAGLANNYYWIDPVKKVAGAVFNQIFPFFDGPAVRVFRDFEKAVYSALSDRRVTF